MARMLKTEYMKLQQCFTKINSILTRMHEGFERTIKVGNEYDKLPMENEEYLSLDKVTVPCHEIIDKKDILRSVKSGTSKKSDLTFADFTIDEQYLIKKCLINAAIFDAWVKETKEGEKKFSYRWDDKNTWTIGTPVSSEKYFIFPNLLPCLKLNDLFKEKPR